jgi:hypothetical protein
MPTREEPITMTTDGPEGSVTTDQRRQLAVELFNGVWRLLESEDRTADQDLTMIHMAHASRYHWDDVGGPEHRARGEWQCARVYAVLGRSEPALFHAEACRRICEEHGIGDWDLAFAFESLARAASVAGDREATTAALERARGLGAEIADPEDRALLEQDLATIVVP